MVKIVMSAGIWQTKYCMYWITRLLSTFTPVRSEYISLTQNHPISFLFEMDGDSDGNFAVQHLAFVWSRDLSSQLKVPENIVTQAVDWLELET